MSTTYIAVETFFCGVILPESWARLLKLFQCDVVVTGSPKKLSQHYFASRDDVQSFIKHADLSLYFCEVGLA